MDALTEFIVTAKYPILVKFMKCVDEYMSATTREHLAFDKFNKIAEEFCSFNRAPGFRKTYTSDRELQIGVLATTLAKIHRDDVFFAAHILNLIQKVQEEKGIPLPSWFQSMEGTLFEEHLRRISLSCRNTPSTTPLN